jgi:toxin YoeB
MDLVLSPLALSQYIEWQKSDPKIAARINEILVSTLRQPFMGIGKPEPLVGNLKGFWSRRITAEHRLVYRVYGKGDEQALQVISCRYHYDR